MYRLKESSMPNIKSYKRCKYPALKQRSLSTTRTSTIPRVDFTHLLHRRQWTQSLRRLEIINSSSSRPYKRISKNCNMSWPSSRNSTRKDLKKKMLQNSKGNMIEKYRRKTSTKSINKMLQRGLNKLWIPLFMRNVLNMKIKCTKTRKRKKIKRGCKMKSKLKDKSIKQCLRRRGFKSKQKWVLWNRTNFKISRRWMLPPSVTYHRLKETSQAYQSNWIYHSPRLGSSNRKSHPSSNFTINNKCKRCHPSLNKHHLRFRCSSNINSRHKLTFTSNKTYQNKSLRRRSQQSCRWASISNTVSSNKWYKSRWFSPQDLKRRSRQNLRFNMTRGSNQQLTWSICSLLKTMGAWLIRHLNQTSNQRHLLNKKSSPSQTWHKALWIYRISRSQAWTKTNKDVFLWVQILQMKIQWTY